MDERLIPLEDANELVGKLRGALHDAVATTTGISVDSIRDRPHERDVTFTLVHFFDGGRVDDFHGFCYQQIDSADDLVWYADVRKYVIRAHESVVARWNKPAADMRTIQKAPPCE